MLNVNNVWMAVRMHMLKEDEQQIAHDLCLERLHFLRALLPRIFVVVIVVVDP